MVAGGKALGKGKVVECSGKEAGEGRTGGDPARVEVKALGKGKKVGMVGGRHVCV